MQKLKKKRCRAPFKTETLQRIFSMATHLMFKQFNNVLCPYGEEQLGTSIQGFNLRTFFFFCTKLPFLPFFILLPLHFKVKYCLFLPHCIFKSCIYFTGSDFTYKSCDHLIKYDAVIKIKLPCSM